MALKILVLLVLFKTIILPQQYPDKKVDDLIFRGIDNLLYQKYDTAEKLFNELNLKSPELPFGNIYLAALELTKSYDLGIAPQNEFIISNLEKAENKSESLLSINNDDKWYNYFAGLGAGYTAYYYALNEDWIRAFSHGYSALKFFERCLIQDSSFFESYIAFGTYKYWKSSKLATLSWLPFIENETNEGISYLQKAVWNSRYHKVLAANSLIWIFINQGQFDNAILTADNILKLYPENRMIKWGLARAYEDINPLKAIDIYYNILYSYKTLSAINEITLLHKIAQLNLRTGNNSEALKLCQKILSKRISDDYSMEVLEERLQRVRILYSELNQ